MSSLRSLSLNSTHTNPQAPTWTALLMVAIWFFGSWYFTVMSSNKKTSLCSMVISAPLFSLCLVYWQTLCTPSFPRHSSEWIQIQKLSLWPCYILTLTPSSMLFVVSSMTSAPIIRLLLEFRYDLNTIETYSFSMDNILRYCFILCTPTVYKEEDQIYSLITSNIV